MPITSQICSIAKQYIYTYRPNKTISGKTSKPKDASWIVEFSRFSKSRFGFKLKLQSSFGLKSREVMILKHEKSRNLKFKANGHLDPRGSFSPRPI